MTDLEILKDMFGRSQIEYKYSVGNIENEYEDYITVERGYAGFVSIFTFYKNGSLKDVEAFE